MVMIIWIRIVVTVSILRSIAVATHLIVLIAVATHTLVHPSFHTIEVASHAVVGAHTWHGLLSITYWMCVPVSLVMIVVSFISIPVRIPL